MTPVTALPSPLNDPVNEPLNDPVLNELLKFRNELDKAPMLELLANIRESNDALEFK
jgi:hypothetical protein